MTDFTYQANDFAPRFSLVDELKAFFRSTPFAIFLAGIRGRD